MSREWVDDMKKVPKDKRWVMRCDVNCFSDKPRCKTESEPQQDVNNLPLERFRDEGWWIAEKHGDICPKCLAAGVVPHKTPHAIMAATA